MTQQGRLTLHAGFVTQIDTKEHRARVKVPDLGVDGLESWWLSILADFSGDNQSYSMPDLNQHVLILADETLRNGLILGGTYTKKSPPPVDSADKIHLVTKDGSTFEYDREAHEFKIELMATAKLSVSNGAGASIEMLPTGAIAIKCTSLSIETTAGGITNKAASGITNTTSSIINNVSSCTYGGKEVATIDAPDSAGQLLTGRGW